MKVKVEFTLDIDADEWAAVYNVPADRVAEDVQASVEGSARELLEAVGVLKDGSA